MSDRSPTWLRSLSKSFWFWGNREKFRGGVTTPLGKTRVNVVLSEMCICGKSKVTYIHCCYSHVWLQGFIWMTPPYSYNMSSESLLKLDAATLKAISNVPYLMFKDKKKCTKTFSFSQTTCNFTIYQYCVMDVGQTRLWYEWCNLCWLFSQYHAGILIDTYGQWWICVDIHDKNTSSTLIE